MLYMKELETELFQMGSGKEVGIQANEGQEEFEQRLASLVGEMDHAIEEDNMK